MINNLNNNSDFIQGKVVGHLEELQKSISNLDSKVDRNHETTIKSIKEVLVKCEENSLKNIKTHIETCPIIDKFNIHLVKYEEKEKYKKENEAKQNQIALNKTSLFRWIVSIVLGILGIKGLWDLVFHTSNKSIQHIDKLISHTDKLIK